MPLAEVSSVESFHKSLEAQLLMDETGVSVVCDLYRERSKGSTVTV